MTRTATDAAGTAYWFLDTLAVVHSPTPPLVIEVTVPPGGSPPLHVHDDLDDCSYLLDGVLAIRSGDHEFRADPGTYVPLPHAVPHTFRVLGTRPARMLLVHGDDSFLRLIRSLGILAPSRTLPSAMAPVPLETLEQALSAVGVRVVGPSMTAEKADAIGRVAAVSADSRTEADKIQAVPDIGELHRRALDVTAEIVANVGPSQWTAPTPCDAWDVRALVNHLVAGNLWAAELVGGQTIEDVGERLDGDLLGADPRRAYKASAIAAAAAFAARGALEASCGVSYGPVPGSVYAGHRFVDVFIHGWDLAAATGQDTTLDPVLVAACQQVVDPQADLLRASGAFGEHITPPAAGDAQTRLLAALGRRAWASACVSRRDHEPPTTW